MLAVSWDTIRLFLHVLAATIWVGGQLVLAALVPVLRRAGAHRGRPPLQPGRLGPAVCRHRDLESAAHESATTQLPHHADRQIVSC